MAFEARREEARIVLVLDHLMRRGIKVYRLPKKRKHKDLIIYSRKRSFAHAIVSGNTAFSMQQTVRTEKAEAAGHPQCRTLNMQEEKVKRKNTSLG